MLVTNPLLEAFNHCRLTVENPEFAELVKMLTPVMAKLACTMDGTILASLIYWLYRCRIVRDVHVATTDYKALFMSLTTRMHELKSVHWLRAISTEQLKAFDIGHSFFDAYKRHVQPVLGRMPGPDLVLLVRWLALMHADTQYLDELFYLAWAAAVVPKMHEVKTESLSGLVISLARLNVDASLLGAEVFRAWGAEMVRRNDLSEARALHVLRALKDLNATPDLVGEALGPHLAKVVAHTKVQQSAFMPALELLGVKQSNVVADKT